MFKKKDSIKRVNGTSALAQPDSDSQDEVHRDSIVQIEDVHKSYVMGKEAVPALRGVSLDVQRGEILCLMGPSGSGKTTMLNIIGGLDTPSRGHVIVDGNNVVALNEEKLAALRLKKMGFVFQNFNLLSNFTALENVLVPLVLTGKRDAKRAQELLRLVGLGDRMGHYPSELSGGQQQRVAIARALANNPPLLIGDEMTGDLDTATSYEIMELLTRFNRERGTTIVFVTHDPRMSHFASRVIHMRDGKLEETVSGQRSAVSSQRLAVDDQQTTISGQQPAPGDQELTISDQSPAIDDQELTISDQPPAIDDQALPSGNPQSAAGISQPADVPVLNSSSGN